MLLTQALSKPWLHRQWESHRFQTSRFANFLMKALSIRQPWAWLIVHGYKDVENRTWSTKFRGRVQVHAGKFPEPGWFSQLALEVEARGIPLPDQPSLGVLVGEVDIIDCVSQ